MSGFIGIFVGIIVTLIILGVVWCGGRSSNCCR